LLRNRCFLRVGIGGRIGDKHAQRSLKTGMGSKAISEVPSTFGLCIGLEYHSRRRGHNSHQLCLPTTIYI
jgi:hypothetical protein